MVIRSHNPAIHADFDPLSCGDVFAGAYPGTKPSGDWGSNEHGANF